MIFVLDINLFCHGLYAHEYSFLNESKSMLYSVDYWRENIERMFSDENVFQFN